MRHTGFGTILLGTILLASGTGVAQSPPDGATTPSPAITTESPGPILTVDFQGGTVAEYVAALRAATGKEPVNVILSREAAAVTLAGISLRSVSLDVAIQAVEPAAGAAQGRFAIRRITPLARSASGGAPVYSVDYKANEPPLPISGRTTPSTGMTPMSSEELAVFSLRDVTEGDGAVRTETVLTAVQAALELSAAADASPPELKYHQDSGLLIVRGSNRQRSAVAESIAAMKKDLERRRRDQREHAVAPEELIERKMMLAQAEAELAARQADMNLAEKLLSQTRELAAAGSAPQRELVEAEATLAKRRAGMMAAMHEIEKSRQLLALAERRAASAMMGGPVVADLAAWPKEHVERAVQVVSALLAATKDRATVTPIGGKSQAFALAGDPRLVESAVGILREIARAHGLADPSLRPAGENLSPAR
ncbi:MAG: hypothetical protein HBSAPP03_29810 [Phycisphaerae bacterium]|nr:MAG: hypothetical protein HBSAPP03_29810 [Phycisphaerae bacterium]